MNTLTEAFGQLFSTDGFIPRRICGNWPGWLVWEHVVGNALIWLAYIAMPVMIWQLGRRRSEWPLPGLLKAFACFIMLCGLGHFLDMMAFFRPMYRLSGHVLIATGMASWWTAWAFRQAWPGLVAMKSPAELERIIDEQTDALQHSILELRRAEADRDYLATIVESTNDAIVGKDLDGVITAWNAGAERLYGYRPAEALGRPITFLIPPDLEHEEVDLLKRLRDGGRADHFESVRVAKGGRLIHVSLTISPIRCRSGQIVGISHIARDITEKHAAEEAIRQLNADLEHRVAERTAELARAKEQAEVGARAKGDFLANMSHEIRTPMNGVIGMADLLLDTELDDVQRNYVSAIHASGEALLTVINDVLDFSKIEAGKLAVESVDFDFRELIEGVADLLAPRAYQKGLEFTNRIDPKIPSRSLGDPTRIRQILTNLAGNAVKFTDRGEVNLEANVVGEDERGVTVRIAVRDTGVGIPAEFQEEIFEAFTQADSGKSRRFGGTGLGLGICRRLVKLMGGRMGLESEPGRGSTFWFELTFGRPTQRSGLGDDRLAGLRVLVVDDHETSRATLRETLASWGCRPEVSTSGAEALASLFATTGDPFRAVLIDEDMPVLDGIRTARAIKSDPRFADLPLILCSEFGSNGDATLEGGLFAATLSKPFRRSHLFEALCRIANSRPIEPRRRESTRGGTALPVSLRILLVEDNEINRLVATDLAEGMGCSVDVATDGLQAVQRFDPARHDLILMDVQMPVMDGLEATAAIRSREQGSGSRVPIIALTAHAMNGDQERCLAAGMDGYLSKPLSRKAFREALTARGVDGAKRMAEAVPADDECFSPGLLRDACGDDAGVRQILELMLSDAVARIQRLEEAIASDDCDRLAKEAHGLRGSALTIGARELAAACSNLIDAARARDLPLSSGALGRVVNRWARLRGRLTHFLADGVEPSPSPSEAAR